MSVNITTKTDAPKRKFSNALEYTGRVKKWIPTRGFGFIYVQNHKSDLYVHKKDIVGRKKRLNIGEQVTFYVQFNPKTNRYKAIKVKGNGEGYVVDEMTGFTGLSKSNYFNPPAKLRYRDPTSATPAQDVPRLWKNKLAAIKAMLKQQKSNGSTMNSTLTFKKSGAVNSQTRDSAAPVPIFPTNPPQNNSFLPASTPSNSQVYGTPIRSEYSEVNMMSYSYVPSPFVSPPTTEIFPVNPHAVYSQGNNSPIYDYQSTYEVLTPTQPEYSGINMMPYQQNVVLPEHSQVMPSNSITNLTP